MEEKWYLLELSSSHGKNGEYSAHYSSNGEPIGASDAPKELREAESELRKVMASFGKSRGDLVIRIFK
jgi:hypothetical protein